MNLHDSQVDLTDITATTDSLVRFCDPVLRWVSNSLRNAEASRCFEPFDARAVILFPNSNKLFVGWLYPMIVICL